MAKAKKVEAAGKIKKKSWYRIQAPKMFNSKIIGDTIANSPEEAKGRVISLSLMNLIGDIKRQNANVAFKIKEVKGETAYSDLIRYEVSGASLKRLVRKGKSRIDDSFLCKTADNVTVRIKPFMLLNTKVKGSIGRNLKSKSNNFIVNLARKSSYESLMRDVISGKIQRQASSICKTVYPVKVFEIRIIEIENPVGKKKIKEAKQEAEAPPEEKVEVKEEELVDENAPEVSEDLTEEAEESQ